MQETRLKKYENMAIIIIVLFIVAFFIAIFHRFKKDHEQQIIKIDSSHFPMAKSDTENNPKVIVYDRGEKSSKRNDPQIKAEQDFSCDDGEYLCITYGWNHGKIIWSSWINGSYKYVKNQAIIEKKKCEDFLCSDAIDKLKN